MRIKLFPAAVAAFVSVLFVSCNNNDLSAELATPDPVQEEVEAQGLEYVAIPAGMDLIGDIGSKASGEEVWDEGVGFWVMDEKGEWIPDEGTAGAALSFCADGGAFAGDGAADGEATGIDAQNAPAEASEGDLTPPYQQNCA
ncbi:MAG: hypothetical protein IJS66_04170, partial [Bacteroidales bacterium]|nr:hypothetical protein [Bacteroidales bacterium]